MSRPLPGRPPALRFSLLALLPLLLLAAPLSGCAPGMASGTGVDAAPYVSKRSFPNWKANPAETGEDLLEQINRVRVREGVAPLLSDAGLTILAGRLNALMVRQQRMSHEGFDQRFALADSDHCVENVAWNYPTAEAVVNGWLRSPDHRANLLDPEISHAGVAFAQGYATFFACRRRPGADSPPVPASGPASGQPAGPQGAPDRQVRPGPS